MALKKQWSTNVADGMYDRIYSYVRFDDGIYDLNYAECMADITVNFTEDLILEVTIIRWS